MNTFTDHRHEYFEVDASCEDWDISEGKVPFQHCVEEELDHWLLTIRCSQAKMDRLQAHGLSKIHQLRKFPFYGDIFNKTKNYRQEEYQWDSVHLDTQWQVWYLTKSRAYLSYGRRPCIRSLCQSSRKSSSRRWNGMWTERGAVGSSRSYLAHPLQALASFLRSGCEQPLLPNGSPWYLHTTRS